MSNFTLTDFIEAISSNLYSRGFLATRELIKLSELSVNEQFDELLNVIVDLIIFQQRTFSMKLLCGIFEIEFSPIKSDSGYTEIIRAEVNSLNGELISSWDIKF
mgnify:CR=1 FL=1